MFMAGIRVLSGALCGLFVWFVVWCLVWNLFGLVGREASGCLHEQFELLLHVVEVVLEHSIFG
jgi:hypothetical protein